MIIFDEAQKWSAEDCQTIVKATQEVDRALMPFSNFELALGTIHFRFNGALKTWAYSTENVIIFRPHKVELDLAIHELGHTFDRRIMIRNYGKSPSQFLWNIGITSAAGEPVTGQLYGYRRYWGKNAPDNGYISDEYPYQAHSRQFEGWNTPQEDWADIWLNWVLNRFAKNAAGEALKSWVGSHMVEWAKEFV